MFQEENYILMKYGGFSYSDALELTHKERGWYIKRLTKDLKQESAAAQKAQGRMKTRR